VRESEVVADEDVAACVHVQRNLASGTYDVGPLSPRHEAAVGLYQRKVRELVAPLLGGSA
jgi:choline monooxygenase